MGDTQRVYVEMDNEEQYEQLKELKKKHGVTWKGMLLQGAKRLEENNSL
ncbi:hypothetical protein [Natronobacterium gregoryi]|uniref:CopG family transcriptional regulator n=2 Tax=Natronobacterium gregoryi TaxID=44930 RepID=L0AK13_NATGS|nr:hypothetical protein [Natronobacterium gregoryi]AFZ73400.1 hypothetical protein Natgr_2223 [Natronobacterium gregoryi SP2]ELY68596.1 hypothetical protein C490_09263 [Natronobacterium gregoryi SP2]SFI73089.1 hypothetical protein SAMN05443661_104103 [Natronobacterium gregoryi]